MRHKVVLSGGYAWVFIHSGEGVCDVVVFAGSVLDCAVKSHEIVLPSPKLLTV